MPAWYRGGERRAGAKPSHPAPVHPAGVWGADWQVAGERGDIDADGAQALADLVSCWLPGDAHRRLVELARGTPRDGVDGGFDDLAARWLDQERLSRLSALIADAGFESPVYAWRYALGQFLRGCLKAGFRAKRRSISRLIAIRTHAALLAGNAS